MNKDEANERMKFAFSNLNGSVSGRGHTGYVSKANWKSRQIAAWSIRNDLKSRGYHWQADRISNYRNRLAKKYKSSH